MAEASQDLQLQMLQTSYFSPAVEKVQSDQYSDVLVRLHFDNQGSVSKLKAELGGVYSLTGSDHHVVVPELYFAQKLKNAQLTFGRQIFPWSQADEDWKNGLWQPQFRWDPLRPETQGLIGAYLHQTFGRFQYMVFVSPLFVPEQGPRFDVVDGRLESSNRWFGSVVDQVSFSSTPSSVVYEVDKPSFEEVVQQKSYGLWALWGDVKDGFWLKGAISQKPMNKFFLGIDFKQQLSANHAASSFSKAAIHPYVVEHVLGTLEGGFATENQSYYVSLSESRPHVPEVPVSWARSKLSRTKILALSATHDFGWSFLKRNQLSLRYLKIWQDPSTRGEDLINDGAVDLESFRFTEAFSVGLASRLYVTGANELKTVGQYIFSPIEESAWLSAQLEFWSGKKWSLFAGVDILGVRGDESKGGFVARNQGNDRVRGGLVYVF